MTEVTARATIQALEGGNCEEMTRRAFPEKKLSLAAQT